MYSVMFLPSEGWVIVRYISDNEIQIEASFGKFDSREEAMQFAEVLNEATSNSLIADD